MSAGSPPTMERPVSVGASESWRVRDAVPDDLEAIVDLWRAWQLESRNPVFGLSDVIAACEAGPAVVVTASNRVVGAAAATIAGERAWVVTFVQHDEFRRMGVGSALLAGLEARLTERGVIVVSAIIPAGDLRTAAFSNSGFGADADMRYLERRIPVLAAELGPLAQLSGRILPRGLWGAIAGMNEAKDIIESRLVLPIERPDVASALGVAQPQAVVLFGPPGTGKTTFARAIASRLSWPFVELHPSTLSSDAAGLASALRSKFEQIADLKHAVVFIDEVEEIAARRSDQVSAPSATNELLKLIPTFRQREGRLFVCATNFVRSLDPAFLRHGRFDYVIPIGLPDAEARRAIWQRYVPPSIADVVDLDAIATASERFSPADIEYAARRAAQRAFDRTIANSEPMPVSDVLDTAGYLEAIGETRPTVDPERLAEFLEDIALLART